VPIARKLRIVASVTKRARITKMGNLTMAHHFLFFFLPVLMIAAIQNAT